MVFDSISDLWNKWNIRSFVLLSLSLQVFLILFSPVRKKTANDRIIFLLWLAYLMADWVAAFAIGLISHNQSNLCAHATEVDGAFQAFWASFLLLHLGGPDTITAFSLEDSSLWRRHLLSLIFQIGAAIYVFAQIFRGDKSLMIPTMLVFLVGVIKNAERIVALNLSSLPRLKEWVISQREFVGANVVPQIEMLIRKHQDKRKASESAVVELAYYFFQIFKIFLGDLMFTIHERNISRLIFGQISAMEALRLISVELQFIYEVLHTKTLAIRSKLSYILRFINFMGVVVAFVLFNRLKRHQLYKVDVKITYILLFGGIVLDVIALFMLIFSDWTLAENMQNNSKSSRLYSLLYILAYDTYELREPRYAKCKAEPTNVTYKALDTPLIFRRWSESISACNLLSMRLKDRPRSLGRDASNLFDFPFHKAEKIFTYFHQAGETIIRDCGRRTTKGKNVMVTETYASKNPFLKKLWLFIFKEVRRKSDAQHGSIGWKDARKVSKARGALYLKSLSDDNKYFKLLRDFIEGGYDDNIIIWHIATEIWYNKEKSTKRKDEREFSKILSDYMLYLLLEQPNVMSAVAGIAQITVGETLRELKESFHISDATQDIEWLCNQLFEKSEEPLKDGQHPKSMLRQGTDLARKMKKLGSMKWKVMSGVWVEMLSYAAVHIKGEVHVQVLSKGGELLAFIWLLMAHFGCVYTTELGSFYSRID